MRARLFFVAFVVLGAMAWYVFSNMGGLAAANARRANEVRLKHAVMVVEANFGGLFDAGYVSWTPTTAAAQLVKTMTAASALSPEEAKEFAPSGVGLLPATTYVLGKPSGPWQVVLVADERRKLIRVEGYGADLETPLITKELSMPSS